MPKNKGKFIRNTAPPGRPGWNGCLCISLQNSLCSYCAFTVHLGHSEVWHNKMRSAFTFLTHYLFTGKGGKNRRRGKNENEADKRELIFKEDGQGW